MKLRFNLIIVLLAASLNGFCTFADSVYIFAYSTTKNNNFNGLHLAWSQDQTHWISIGPEHSLVRNDYGRWGSQKKMFSPFLFQDPKGTWQLVYSLNESDGAFGHTSSQDLIYWGRQSYPIVSDKNIVDPEIHSDGNHHKILWKNNENQYFQTFTSDFKSYSITQKINPFKTLKVEAIINGEKQIGTVHKVSFETVQNVINAWKVASYKHQENSERLHLDPKMFKEPISFTIQPQPQFKKSISDMLMGIFYEDINYAADGGLYAELIQNRDFEYGIPLHENKDPKAITKKAWSTEGNIQFEIDSTLPIHKNNKRFAVLTSQKGAFINEGFNGINLKAGYKYDLSYFGRTPNSVNAKVKLVDSQGKVVAEKNLAKPGKTWKKYELTLIPNQNVADAKLVFEINGQIHLDMISLFPQKTFKGRKNGLREDLAQVIADLKPRFVRFPGGCVAHGDGIDNMYRWENTIGPLEARTQMRNLWGYHQTLGLGYYEYFQFCEDINAEPIPIVAAGVPCQNSGHNGCAIGGQQGGIPLEHMDEYIQTILNLIEWANGDAKSEWGAKRAAAGHPKPFGLKYIGVGNEDLITDIFEERFKMINDAIKAKYPEIQVIGTAGPFNEGTDYVEGWKIAKETKIPYVDEHYYQSPGWYLNNQKFYDSYDRNGPKVYLGEYAAHIPGRHNNLETALSEAMHLINVERNGDIVAMTSYAPLLAKEGFTQWNPDLIYFNNQEVKPTVGYEVQKLFGHHTGDTYIPHTHASNNPITQKRIAVSIVKDKEDIIVKMVNALPVSVKANLDLTTFNKKDISATILTGQLEDKDLKPKDLSVALDQAIDVPAYSLIILRLK